MATVNGTVDRTDAVQPPANHLGKRKRSESPCKLSNGTLVLDFQKKLRAALTAIHRSAPTDALLTNPLPPESPKQTDSKRARLTSDELEKETNTIEARIQAGSYASLDDLKVDVTRVQAALQQQKDSNNDNNGDKGDSSNSTDSGLNGNAANEADTGKEHALDLVALLAAELDPLPEMRPSSRQQIITLNAHTEKGTQQLYSGLQVSTHGNRRAASLTNGDGEAKSRNKNNDDENDDDDDDVASIDGRRLPNGFDVTDAAAINSALVGPPKEKRLFGDVFRPRASLKPLEQPRPRKPNTATTLSFESSLVPDDRTSPILRSDYKYQPLPTSTWLTYGKGTPANDPEAIKKQHLWSSSPATDFGPPLATNSVAIGSEADNTNTDALFKGAFSSFAPAYDSTRGLVNDGDRNRLYWRRFGPKRWGQIFQTDYPPLEEPSTSEKPVNNQDKKDDVEVESFDKVVASFQPTGEGDGEGQGEGSFPSDQDDNLENVDDVLEEVSNLLETVHSYQQIRAASSSHSSDISGQEFDAYEILRSQLSILVSSLPPFAVAKLDGDKLNDLAISTTILVEGADYRGTGQPDEYTLQKYRAAQQAAPAVTTRPSQAQPSARNQYSTPATAQRYNTSFSPLTSQTPFNRPMAAAPYQQPPATQRPFQTSAAYTTPATVQQFQRPLQNGYAYNAANGTPGQAAYPQTPSQPGYQQRAQQQAAAAAAAAHQHSTAYAKPLINGQTAYYNQATPG